jgi:fructokinase
MTRILCIGEALIDMICTDRDVLLSEGQHFLKKAGGAPTNVAAAIAALGGAVSLAAKVGADPFGNHLVAVMQDFGVDTAWMLQDKDLFTTFAFVSLLQSGERDFVFNRGADGALSKKDLEALSLPDYGIVHFGSATGFLPGSFQETYKHYLHAAKEQGAFISFDPNYRQLLFPHGAGLFISQSRYFIEACDFFKLSDEEALLITETGTLDAAVEKLRSLSDAVFAITIGSKGTMLRVGDKLETVPSIPVQPVDTTGAGDAFVGALLYQLSSRVKTPIIQLSSFDDWRKLVLNANKAGARTCEFMGAMEAFKHLSAGIFD